MNILVVEDEDSVATLLSDVLVRWGHQVHWSPTGYDALERVQVGDVDLIFLDMSLPDIRGHELIPFLKASQPHAGVVTMTENNSRKLEAAVRKEGVAYYMIKPLELKVLKEVVEHASKRRRPFLSQGRCIETGEMIAN